MTIELWAYDTPNGRKVSVALEELELPYEVRVINITKDEQHAAESLRISPSNRIPAIIDPDVPSGQTISVFESGAILLYLAQKTGRFWPADPRSQVTVQAQLGLQPFGPRGSQDNRTLLEPFRSRRIRSGSYLLRSIEKDGVRSKTRIITDEDRAQASALSLAEERGLPAPGLEKERADADPSGICRRHSYRRDGHHDNGKESCCCNSIRTVFDICIAFVVRR